MLRLVKGGKSKIREDVLFFVKASTAVQIDTSPEKVTTETIVPDKHKTVSFVALGVNKVVESIHLEDRQYQVGELVEIILRGIKNE